MKRYFLLPFSHTIVLAIVNYTIIRILWHCLKFTVRSRFFKYSTFWRSNPYLDPWVEGSKPQWFSCFLPSWSVDSYQTGLATGPGSIGEDVKEWVTARKENKYPRTSFDVMEVNITWLNQNRVHFVIVLYKKINFPFKSFEIKYHFPFNTM